MSVVIEATRSPGRLTILMLIIDWPLVTAISGGDSNDGKSELVADQITAKLPISPLLLIVAGDTLKRSLKLLR